MKLNAILEELIPIDRKEVQLNRQFTNSRRNDRYGDAALAPDEQQGLFSIVKQDHNDPHMVKKYNKEPSHNLDKADPYWVYVDYLIERDLPEKNPYFPRFYGIKSYRDSLQKEHRKLTMEKLEPYDYNEFVDHIASNIFIDIPEDVELYDLFAPIENGDTHNINDENLINAINHLRICKRRNNLKFDLHNGNFMIRRTKYGPQLVITDPFS